MFVGASVYLSISEAVSSGVAAAASEDCKSGAACEPSRYVIQRLPSIEETTVEPGLYSPPAPLLPTTTGDNNAAAPAAQETVAIPTPQTAVTPTPTQEFLTLGDPIEPPAEIAPVLTAEPGDEPAAAGPESALMTASSAMTSADRVVVEAAETELVEQASISATAVAAGVAVETPEPQVEVDETAEEEPAYREPFTSTAQVQPPPATNESEPAAELSLAAETVYSCPTSSEEGFELIPLEGQPLKDHPSAVHGDLNLVLRGYIPTGGVLDLVDYEGATDGNAPQLAGLFEPHRLPRISSIYQVNDWIWDSSQCGGHPRGCPGPPAETYWAATVVGLATTPGEPIYIPERSQQIYRGGYVALVLYAEKERITLGYTRRNNVATGYVVHIEDICVNPHLLALYQAQLDGAGWNDSGHLPGLRNNQAFGTALGHEVKIAIRDAGSFMDPRSRKDWWR